MKTADQYALMSLGILLIFIKDIVSGTYAILMFPIIIPVFFLCLFGAIMRRNENE